MSDLRYKVTAETTQAQQSMEKLRGSIKNTSDDFIKFRNVIGTIAIGSFVRSAYQSADAISEIGKASGLGTQFVLGFTRALEQNGGSAETAQTAIARFGQSIQGALGGSQEAIDKFKQLGISVEQLANMSDRDIMKLIVEKLAKGGNSAITMAAAMDLLSKGIASVDFGGVNAGLDANIQKAGASADAYDTAGQAADAFKQAAGILQEELIKALEPLSRIVIQLKEFQDRTDAVSETIGKFFGWIVKIGAVLATVAAAFALFGSGVGEVGVATGVAVGLFARLFGLFRSIGVTIGSVMSQFKGLTRALAGGGAFFEELGVFISTFVAKRLPFLGKAFGETGAIIAKHWKALTILIAGGATAIGTSLDWIKEKLGFKLEAPVTDDAKRQAATAAFLKKEADAFLAQKAIEDKKAAVAEAAAKKKKIIDDNADKAALNEENNLNSKLQGYKDANAQQLKGLQTQLDMVALSEREKAVRAEIASAETKYSSELNDLKAKEAALKNDIAKGDAQTSATALKELPLVQAKIADVTAEYEKQSIAVKKTAGDVYDATLKQAAAQDILRFGIEQRLKSEADVKQVQEDIAKLTMTDIEKKYYDIGEAAKANAKARIDSINLERKIAGDIVLTKAEEQAYYDEAIKANKELIDIEQERYNKSRQASTGFIKSMKEYKEAATDAAKNAEAVFKKATQGMEDAIVSFAKTGKFEWKSFVSSIVEELLRQQVRELIAKTFGGMSAPASGGGGGGGGIMGLIGSIFGGGFANGGIIPTNGPVLIGERGPELLMGAAGRSVIPNNQLGGGTTVVYNINAVDAMSFKQMVARDPSFIYAVSQQGAKSIPSTRR